MLRIDAHQHLWRFSAEEYGWLTEDLAPLRRDFMKTDLLETIQAAGVQGTIVVQARQTVEETKWLLDTAVKTEAILGVVGWLPLHDTGLPALLERFMGEPLLKGVRHVVQAEPEGFMDDAAFRQGIAQIASAGLCYDILIYERQLAEATRLVDAFPDLQFVLDHIAKPSIGTGDFQFWADGIAEIARRPNVVCKLSGVVTEAKRHQWSAETLRPYFDVVLNAFQPDRLLFGSDWPVVLSRCSYVTWLEMVTGWTAQLSAAEQAAIFAENTLRTYRAAVRTE